MDEEELNRITEAVIGAAYRVRDVLGQGFLEKVYENALAHECRKAGLRAEQQRQVSVYYDGVEVGYYVADLVINGVLLVEVKAVTAIDDAHVAQGLNYLAATGLSVCLILNFGKRVEVRRLRRFENNVAH